MSGGSNKSEDMGLVYLAIVALAIGLAYFLWYSFHADISYYALKWAWYQLAMFDWPFMPIAIRKWRQEAAVLAWNPSAVGFFQLVSVLNHAGLLFVWIPVVLTLRGIAVATRHKAHLTRRKVTAKTLPWIMSTHSPAIIPTLYYGDKDTLLLNVDPEEHRSAISPQEWVEQHGLLVNNALDRDRCRQLFVADLGETITSIEQLQLHERALFAVFGARLFSGGQDLALSQVLLDQLNRSCHKHTWEGKPGYPDLTITAAAFETYSKHPDVAGWIGKHRYARTLLHALHQSALAGGKLPSSHFRWLKGMDRSLWYALNTTGRKVPFLESAAVFVQTQWEVFAFESGYRLTEPFVDDAIDGVQAYLVKIGLMAPPDVPQVKQGAKT